MLTALLAEYIASARARHFPDQVRRKAALHLLDTVAAMVSGTELPAGRHAAALAASMGGCAEASVVGSGLLTNAHSAALANGMAAHADESDDSHARSLTHPGCAIVPAAIATAERYGRGVEDVVTAIIVGYDVATRISMALGGEQFFERGHSTHSFGGVFGATAAASVLAHHDQDRAAYALAYAVQMASGNTCWRRDPDHIEKAFDFGGMPAHSGCLAERMVSVGMTGSSAPLEQAPGLLAAFGQAARADLAVEALGERFEVMATAIKKWCVGSPIQAALDSVAYLMLEKPFAPSAVESIVVALPRNAAPVVDDRQMPAVNLQHQITLLVHEGVLTFNSSHDLTRLARDDFRAFRRRVSIEPRSDKAFEDNPRQAIVSIRFADGSTRMRQTMHVRGTPANPMNEQEVFAKAEGLMRPVLGAAKSATLQAELAGPCPPKNIRDLRPLWTITAS